jgi:putative ABC transport system permease protein
VFRIENFVPPLWPLIGAAALAALVVMLIGLYGTRRVLNTSPMALLREG